MCKSGRSQFRGGHGFHPRNSRPDKQKVVTSRSKRPAPSVVTKARYSSKAETEHTRMDQVDKRVATCGEVSLSHRSISEKPPREGYLPVAD